MIHHSPYKQSEVFFPKDDLGNDYCVHNYDDYLFEQWNNLWTNYRVYENISQFFTIEEYFKENDYNGPDFVKNLIGCPPEHYVQITVFQSEENYEK